jgi:hypothetical protein
MGSKERGEGVEREGDWKGKGIESRRGTEGREKAWE